MGHPKALTRIDGEPALVRLVRACESAGLTRPLVVQGAHHDIVRQELRALEGRVGWLRNAEPDAGRTGSLQLALARLPEARAVLVWPIDHPLATAKTARALLAVAGEWVVPEMDGRGGHPIVLRAGALDAVRAALPDAPLREVLSAAGVVQARVRSDDAGVLANLDRPGDVEAAFSTGEMRQRDPKNI